MNWYLQSNENSDVAQSTRVRFARNLHDVRFNLTKKEEIQALENKVKESLYNIDYKIWMILQK